MIDETELAVLPTLKTWNSVDSVEYAVLRARQKALRTVLKPLSDQLKSLTLDVDKKTRQLEYKKSPVSPTAIYNFFYSPWPADSDPAHFTLLILVSLQQIGFNGNR